MDAFSCFCFFFFQAEDGIRDATVTGVQTCALPICLRRSYSSRINGISSSVASRSVYSSGSCSFAAGISERFVTLQIGRASCRGKSVDLGGRSGSKKKKRVRKEREKKTDIITRCDES